MTSSVTTIPPAAIRCPATRAALRGRGWLPWLGLLTGLVCAPLTVVLLALRDSARTRSLANALTAGMMLSAVVFTVGITVGGGAVWTLWRRRRALRRHPWLVWPINYISTGRHEWVELLDAQRQPVSALILSTWRKDVGKLVGHNTSEIWFAGDPHKYGVISRPGGGDLRYAYYSPSRQPPRFTFRNREGAPEQSSNDYVMVDRDGPMLMESAGAGAAGPVRHGAYNDQRYPSPRMLRRAWAFTVDIALHLVGGLGLGVLVSPGFSIEALRAGDWQGVGLNVGYAVLCCLAVSFLNRVVVQSFTRTTVGKAVFGLVVLRPDTGRYPGFGRLLGVWLFDLYLPLAFVGNGVGPDHPEHYFLTAVRRHDMRSVSS